LEASAPTVVIPTAVRAGLKYGFCSQGCSLAFSAIGGVQPAGMGVSR
jgi:hypothetical protein